MASVAATIVISNGILHYTMPDPAASASSHEVTAQPHDKWKEWATPLPVALTDPRMSSIGESFGLALMAPTPQHSRDIAGVATFFDGCIVAFYKPSLHPDLLSLRVMSRTSDSPDAFVGNQPYGDVLAFLAEQAYYCKWQRI